MPRVVSDIVATYPFRRGTSGVEFLLVRRAAGDEYLAGVWSVPSGRIERGETAWQAALRELKEETGLEPLRLFVVNTVPSFYIPAQDAICLSPSFAAEVPAGGEVRLNLEHDAAEWLSPPDAVSRLLWPGQRSTIQEILDEIVTPGPALAHMEIDLSGNPNENH